MEILDASRTVEKRMTIEAIYISKLKPGPNKLDNYGDGTHPKILFQITFSTEI